MARVKGRLPTTEEIEEWSKFAGSDAPSFKVSSPAGGKAPKKQPAMTADAGETDRSRSGGRVPTQDELRDWAELTGGKPPDPESPPPQRERTGPAASSSSGSPPPVAIEDFQVGSLRRREPALSYEESTRAPARESRGGIDRKVERRLKSGRLDPEMVIDLHGLDRRQAESRLLRFLQNCRARKVRLALVVTGKGKASRMDWHEEEPGVLRRSVPLWLQQEPMSRMVQYFTVAHSSHGGYGAYYVYLRQARSR